MNNKDKRLPDIIDKIISYIDPVKIILFGSRAGEDAKDDSDYDIVVIYDGAKTKREVELGIRRQLRPRNFSLDLFIMRSNELESYKDIANTLAREITESGIVVYGR
ncbi:MAG: nucleotidyltransferase domain-containing protein [candidate division Zixibacteria bacterium]|nr:nucleotidyltransferase domain-containing protein [Candidatus Tariuqbacter arcticus]